MEGGQSLPKRNRSALGGGNNTAFPFFPTSVFHELMKPRRSLTKQRSTSPSLFPAGPLSAASQGQVPWKHHEHESEPLPDPHIIKSFSHTRCSFHYPKNICSNIKNILLLHFSYVNTYLNTSHPLIIHTVTNFPFQTLRLFKPALLLLCCLFPSHAFQYLMVFWVVLDKLLFLCMNLVCIAKLDQ